MGHTAGPAGICVSHLFGPARIYAGRLVGQNGGLCAKRSVGQGRIRVGRNLGARLARRAEFLMAGSLGVFRGFILVSDEFALGNSLM